MPETPFYIHNIKLTNFKNFGFISLDFSENLNFITGNNGIGKTSLLDAVYYTCFTKSYLTSSDLLVPNFKDDFFRIESNIVLNTENQSIEIKYLKQEKKEVLVNKVRIDKQAEFIGKYPCVIIIPDDNQLILGGSEVRRKFIDSTLSQLSREYFTNLVIYNKILAQRNALLKSFYENRSFNKDLLDIYTQKLLECGKIIFNYRKQYLQKFVPIFQTIYQQIFKGNESISITYESELLLTDFETVMSKNEQQDRTAQRTTEGIHTDDLVFELNNFPIRKIGSQGQQKTFLLSLKLAQYELLKLEKQVPPLLLLDDIFDKLDVERISSILRLINTDRFSQVFITHTDEKAIQALIRENEIQNYKIINLGPLQK
ncbi:MAG: replication and repair protein recF [Bacteroidota bacterium]|nr:replication and repair protein recF [Bacteroidota bacterium]